MNNNYQYINLSDPRQDVHKIRKHNPHLHRYDVAEKLLPKECTGLKVLDLGGGTGEMSRRMKEKGIQVTFVDLNDNNIKRVKVLGIESTYKKDLNNGLGEFGNEAFDGVVMLEIIEHIVAAEFLLKEVNRILKVGGFLIISTPNFAYFQNRLRILFGKLSVDEGYHYRFFTWSSIKQKLQSNCFIISENKFTMPAMGYNFVMNKIFKRPRKHIYVPKFLASVFSQTMFVKAIKIVNAKN